MPSTMSRSELEDDEVSSDEFGSGSEDDGSGMSDGSKSSYAAALKRRRGDDAGDRGAAAASADGGRGGDDTDDDGVDEEQDRIERRIAPTLYPGCKYTGYQTSDDRSYDVQVAFKHVDFENSYVCGDLLIRGLTDQYPELITFFEGEVIGEHHSFLTGKWDTDKEIDLQHWQRFPAFEAYASLYDAKGFVYDFHSADHVFMRWKEHFLVPDHTVQDIKGASFAGFYYVCFCKSTGTINGYYYHSASEWFQELNLTLLPERGFGTYEFR
eukprot:m.286989 g.286989  ORF g.286989 m.286989 type:complete len:268 (+) comp19442_c2_seq1:171-974(+)